MIGIKQWQRRIGLINTMVLAVTLLSIVAVSGQETKGLPAGKPPAFPQLFSSSSISPLVKLNLRSRFLGSRPEILWTAGGHSGPVRAVAYSPDGQMLATGSDDLTVKIWRISDGMALHRLTGHTLGVSTVAFSPDGQLLATGEQSGQAGGSSSDIRIWHVADGSLVRAINLPGVHSYSVAFSPDGGLLASAGNDRNIKIWRVFDGTLLQTLSGHTYDVTSVAFAPDGQTLASGSGDKTVKIWRVSDWTVQQTLTHTDGVKCVAFAPDGLTVAAGGGRNITIWNLSDGTLQRTIWEGRSVASIAFSPDGQTLLSGSVRIAWGVLGKVELWRVSDGQSLGIFIDQNDTNSVAFSPDGQTVVSGHSDNTYRLWRVSDKALLQTVNSHASHVEQVAISPDGQIFASCGADATIRVRRTSDGSLLRILTGHTKNVISIAFSPDGRTLVSGSADRTIKVWRVSDWTLAQTLTTPTGDVYGLAFSPDGQMLAAALTDTTVQIYRAVDWTLLRTLSGHTAFARCVAFSPDGQLLASGAGDQTVRIWRVPDWTLLRTLTGGGLRARCLAFSPDGQTLAVGYSDEPWHGPNVAKLWRVADGQDLCTLEGHQGHVTSVAFSLDGQILVTSSTDRTKKIWRIADGWLMRSDDEGAGVDSVTFSPDGQFLGYGLGDGSVVWALAPVLTNQPPQAPTLLAPADGALLETLPVFQMSATDADNNLLRYRIELSQDNFQTIAKVYDGTISAKGWNKSSYASGEVASFSVSADDPITSGNYQWRAYAFDGREWSTVSETRSFTLQLVQPIIISVSPNTVSNIVSVKLHISGLNFKDGLQVWLEKAGQPNILGSDVSLEADRVITAVFGLISAALGKWDVVVRNPDGQSGRLPEGLTVIAPCDLTLEGLSGEPLESLADGQQVTAKVKLKNIAAADAVGIIEVTFEAWGQKVSMEQRGGLAAGTEAILTAKLTAKAGADRSLIATADPANAIAETNEDNNVAQLTMPEVPFPDLTITNLEFEPKNPRSGDTVRLTATVKNIGSKLLSPFFTTFFADETQVALEPSYAPIDTGQEVKVSVHFRACAGVENIRAKVDAQNQIAEANENNNEFSIPFPAIQKPDLVAVELQLIPAAPAAGSLVTFSLKVKNSGQGEQAGGFSVGFFADGTSVGTMSYVYSLAKDQEATVNCFLRWRAQGGRHTLSAVVDPKNEVAETDEQNNTAQKTITIPAADLVTEDPQMEPQELIAGTEATIRATIRNKGESSAGAFLVALFEGDKFVNSRWLSGLATGSSATVSFIWRAGSGVPTLRLVADVNNTVAESDEGNNEATLSLPTINPPDFIITHIDFAPATPVQGDEVNIQATIRNIGAPFAGGVLVRFRWDSYRLSTRVTLSPQNPEAVAVATLRIPELSQPAVLLALEATVDPTNVLFESNEGNNTMTKPTNVCLGPPDLTITKIVVQPTAQPVPTGTLVPIVIQVQNLGVPCKGAFDLLLFVDGRQVDSKPVQMTGELDEKKEVTMYWEATPGSQFNFAAQVNITDAVTGNNTLTQTVALTVLAPDLQVTKLEFEPQTGVKLNDSLTFKVTVKNNGPGDIKSDVSVYMHVSGKPTKEGKQFINGLQAGEEKTLAFTWVASEQAHPRAVAIADSDSRIQEVDETNNSLSVDLPFDVAREDAFEVALKPAEQLCPMSVQTNYTVTVKSWITVPTIFELSVEGLPSNWFALSAKEVYLQAGEWKESTLSVTPPADAQAGEKTFQVKATRKGTTDVRAADGKAQVAASTVIIELLPEDGQTLPSDTVTVTWRTAVASSSEVFLKAEEETDYRRYEGLPGTFHQVVASGLRVGKRYHFYVQSVATGSTSQSTPRTIILAGGVAFTQKNYTFQVLRDWMQTVTVAVRNLSSQSIQAVATVQNPYDPEIVVGFGGSGSVDEALTLAPNETKQVTLTIHAATAARAIYELPIKVKSGSEAAPLTDIATVKVQVPLKADLEMQELSTDPVTLVKRFRLINKSDVPVADIRLELDENLRGRVSFRPQVEMLRLEPKSSMEFELVPVFELAAHRNPEFASRLQVGRAILVDTPEAQQMRQRQIGGSLSAVSGAGSTQQATTYSLGDRNIYATLLKNRHIKEEVKVNTCTNQRHAEMPIQTPPTEEDEVTDPFLLVSLEPRNPYGWPEKPHDVFFKVNGYPVGSINNEVPKGVYMFEVPTSVLNLSPTNTTTQRIEMDTTVYNSAHYWRVGDMELHIFVNQMVVYVAARNEEEALRIAQNQPYFEAHADTNFDKVRAAIKKYVNRHAANWWNTLDWDPVPWAIGAGELNNWYYFNNTDPDTKRFFAEYRCIGWTKNLMDEFARLKGKGELEGIRVSAARSVIGDHNYVVMWKEGTNPIDTGIVIDPWMKEQYAELPLKQALRTGAYTHGGGIMANSLVADEAGYFHTDYSPVFGDDYKELFKALANYYQQRGGPYSLIRQPLQAINRVPISPSFYISVKGAVYASVTTSEGKRFGWLPSGEFVNDLGTKLATGQSEEPAAVVMMVEGLPPCSWEVNISPATAQTATVRLGWLNQSGEIVTAKYDDVPVGQRSSLNQGTAPRQGQLQGAALTIDLSQPPQPFITADGQKIYPNTAEQTAVAATTALTQRMRQILPAGLSMISLPADIQGTDPATILDAPGGDLKLARWNPESPGENKYQIYPDVFVSSLDIGGGYWVKLPQTTPVELAGTRARENEPFSIQLKAGWNMIGNPFVNSLLWDLSKLQVKPKVGPPVSLNSPVALQYIEDYAWGWQQNPDNPKTGSYYLIYDSSVIPVVANQLAPWQGYWVKAHQTCELVLPPPAKAGQIVKLEVKGKKEKASANNWQVLLAATAGQAKDLFNLFGVTTKERVAKGKDQKVKIESPPRALSQGYVDLYFVDTDNSSSFTSHPSLAIDLRPPLSGKATWRFVVETDIPNADVAITWWNLSSLPKNYKLVLVDEETGKRRYMRTTSAYVFKSGKTGTRRNFRIEVDPSGGQPLRVYDIIAVPNRAEGTISISYKLSAAASVEVKILNLTGRLVRTVSLGQLNRAGINSVVWNLRDEAGMLVPNGIYLCQISAVTEEGQATKGTRAIMVMK